MARLHLILLLIAMGTSACSDHSEMQTHENVRIGERSWKLELALNDAAITQGLMGRESIRPDEGMLFIFPDNEVRSFWMANCLIDIDLIFIDSRGSISNLHRMKAEPPRAQSESLLAYQSRLKHYWSSVPVRFAIELPTGSIEALSLAPNQRLELDVDALKALRSRADSLSRP